VTDPAPRRDRFPLLLSGGVVLVLLVVGAAGLRSWRDLATQRAREASVASEIARTEADVRRLEERIRRLKEDPFTLERLARHELGLVRPEDLVMVFPAATDAATAALPPMVTPPAPGAAPSEPEPPVAPAPPAARASG
jgi:cell division protein FtsB